MRAKVETVTARVLEVAWVSVRGTTSGVSRDVNEIEEDEIRRGPTKEMCA